MRNRLSEYFAYCLDGVKGVQIIFHMTTSLPLCVWPLMKE